MNLKFRGYNDPDAKAAEKYVKAIIDKFNGQGTKTISKLLEIATETIPSKRTREYTLRKGSWTDFFPRATGKTPC